MIRINHHLSVLFTIFLLAFCFILSSCTFEESVVQIKMVNENPIEIKAGEFSYDGIRVLLTYESGKTKEVNLNDKMIPESEKLNFYKMGEHEIPVVWTSKVTTTMKVNVVRHEFDDIYKLEGYSCVYDGKPHKVEINYELPEGTTVEYPYGNTFTNVGEHTVEAVISKPGYVSKKFTTTLIIETAPLDVSGVELHDNTFLYDGQAKTLEATNIPEGIKVEYEIWNEDKTIRLNNAINVGTYTIVAKLGCSDENYDQTQTKEAKLTITKATYDMSKVYLDDVEKEYDGNEYSARLADSSVLPEDVSVAFKYYDKDGKAVEKPINAGEYKIVAEFDGKNANYEDIAPMEAKLTITKKKISIDGNVVFNSKTVNFDRESHKIEVSILRALPSTVTITYENNEKIEAGQYKAIARFVDSNVNEELDIQELEAYLIINKIVEAPQVMDSAGQIRDLVSDDLKLTVEPTTGNKTMEIVGFLEDKYNILSIKYTDLQGKIVDVNDFCDNVKYNVDIIFELKDEIAARSVNLSPFSGQIKNSITFENDLKLEDLTVVYDGKPHGVSINKELPVGTIVEYPNGEEFTEVGLYQIVWVLSKKTYANKELTANLKITQAKYDMSGVVLENVTRTYDGEEYTPEKPKSKTYNQAFDNLPEGVTVKSVTKYTWVSDNWQESEYTSNVGKYKIVIAYDYDTKNYEPIQDMEFELEVTQKTIDLSNVKFEDTSLQKVGGSTVGYVFKVIDGTPLVEWIPQFADTIDPNQYYDFPKSTDLPENIYVIYTYKDSNDQLIATVDTSKKFKVVSNLEIYMADDANGTNQVPLNLPKNGGTYTVTATFVASNSNIVIPENSAKTATLTILEP